MVEVAKSAVAALPGSPGKAAFCVMHKMAANLIENQDLIHDLGSGPMV